MTDLTAAARDWALAVHPHARHLDRTLEWVDILDPDASEALRIAAVTHDIERAFPDPDATWDSARDWDSPEYNRWHQDRCADLVAPGCASRARTPRSSRTPTRSSACTRTAAGRRPTCCRRPTRSASSTRWSRSCSAGPSAATPTTRAAKLRHSLDRMAPDQTRARAFAAPKVERALAQLGADRADRHPRHARRHRGGAEPRARARRRGLVRSGRVFRLARERFPRHAAVPRPPAVPGPLLPHAAGDPRGRRPAVGPGQRRRPRLHVRGRARQPAHRRAHRRPRAHDGRRRRPLARRLGARRSSATSARSPATRPRSRRCGGAASSTTWPASARSTRSPPATR